MKRIITLISFLAILTLFPGKITAQNIDGGVYFYSSLAPYGSWVQLSGGVTVWRPGHTNGNWAPYTEGYWEWTNDGWYWESNEPFGYITYHYGRWYYDDYYGWIWIPDNQWAPAWVEWRYDDDYIGWAPLPPYAGFSISIGIHFTRRYETHYGHWHFLKYRHMCDRYGYKYYVPSNDVYRIYSRTKYRTNYGYSNGRVINRGVNIDYVRTRGGRDIRERTIERVNDPGQLRNNDNWRSDRIRTYSPGRENIGRENVDARNIDRSDRRSSLDLDNLSVGRERNIDRTNQGRDITTQNRGEVRNNDLLRNRNDNNLNNRTDPNFNGDRNIERRNERDRSAVERNRTTTRPRNEAPRVRNEQKRERPQVRTERNNNRGNEKKQDDKGRKRIR